MQQPQPGTPRAGHSDCRRNPETGGSPPRQKDRGAPSPSSPMGSLGVRQLLSASRCPTVLSTHVPSPSRDPRSSCRLWWETREGRSLPEVTQHKTLRIDGKLWPRPFLGPGTVRISNPNKMLVTRSGLCFTLRIRDLLGAQCCMNLPVSATPLLHSHLEDLAAPIS